MQTDVTQSYERQVESLMGTLSGVDALRAKAIKVFAERGVPAARAEDWRYSDLKPVRSKAYVPAKSVTVASVDPALSTNPAARFVFVNGRYAEEWSDLGDLWQAVSIRPLGNHLMANPDRADELTTGTDGLSALNTALMQDGMVLSVPSGVEIEDPIEITHVMTDADSAAVHVRHVIELGEGASATVVEHFVGGDDAYWLNGVLQGRVSEGAKLGHIRIQEDGASALHTAKAHVSVGAGGLYSATNIALGGSVARFEAHVRLLVDGAEAYVDGVALAGTGQSHDMLVHVDHRMPDTNSDQIFRTVADARGKTSFQGKVTVAKDAQKVEADQSFKALLLDRTGEANAKPELEIFADDVKCSHGATVGELDAKALFYLVSRGIDPITARQMLVEAFTDEALARITDGGLQDAVREKINSWMTDHARSA